MLILHTADWHLGRIFHGIHLTDDQAYLLAQLEQLIAERKPDVYVISGDIYDRSVPPSSAVELLSDHLTRIVRDLNVPAILIAGNHDSPERLHFGSRLFADNRLHIYGQTEERVRWVELEDKHGPVRFYPVPYADPAMVRYVLGDPSLEDHNGAMRALVDRIVALHPPDMRSVLITHAFAAGGMISESERPLSVGGTEQVDTSLFKPFDFTALGHLHQPQAPAESVRYAGSLMKYSLSEAKQRKVVSLIDLSADGSFSLEEIQLSFRHDLRIVEGHMEALLQGQADDGSREDYLAVRLLDREPVYDAMSRLREVYPNIVHLERKSLAVDDIPAEQRVDSRKMTEAELFSSFCQFVTGEECNDREMEAFREALKAVCERKGEAR